MELTIILLLKMDMYLCKNRLGKKNVKKAYKQPLTNPIPDLLKVVKTFNIL